MEVVLVLLAIASVIIRIVKKAQDNAQENAKNFEPPMAPQPPKPKKPEPVVTKSVQRKTRSMDHVEGQAAQTAFTSSEGFASSEGQCVEPDPNHCAVEHFEDSIYVTEIKDEAPVTFNRENLVQGIIMAEILKPKWSE